MPDEDLDPRNRTLRDRISAAVGDHVRKTSDCGDAVSQLGLISGPVTTGHSSPVTISITVSVGRTTITEAQMAELHHLVADIVRHGRVRHAQVWGKLNRRFHVGAARGIQEGDYPAARRYLEQWRDRLVPPPPPR